jgi:uroporphyrinogen III methyltransferase/synthase
LSEENKSFDDSVLTIGKVFLVGAGPGDPGLITVRGATLLEQADVVIYDNLANPRLLSYCPRAKSIYVGKKSSDHTLTQEKINELLVTEAKKGRRVVRLKGGDPFVFGRGGEECEALLAAGVQFEIVPGITAAIAASAYAGIPISHRDMNSSITLVTGHEKEETSVAASSPGCISGAVGDIPPTDIPPTDIQWDVLAKLPCLAFYMGIKSLGSICRKLIAGGMSPDMPAATIHAGTHPHQKTVVATVATLEAEVRKANLPAPAITIIGRMVLLRDKLKWFENRPLFGQTIVVTRTRQQASELTQKLEALGATVIEAPTIEIGPAADPQSVDAKLRDIGKYDWTVFTSANGVAEARRRIDNLGLDCRTFGKTKIAAIGEVTAKAIREQLCLHVDLCPPSFVAEALAHELIAKGEVTGKRFLLLRADIARPILREKLLASGAAEVADVPLYQTLPAQSLPTGLEALLQNHRITCITFASASSVRNFLALLGPNHAKLLQGVNLASIGPITSEAMRQAGLNPSIQAETFNIPGLVTAISKHVAQREVRP